MEEKIQELEALVEDLSDKLAENFYQTIQILSALVSTQETFFEGSHSRFVSIKSAEVARKLGMTGTDVYETEIAGLLHDIGKIGFRDSLQMKSTHEMRESEFRQYTMHPEIGYQMLTKNSSFQTIAEIILAHHEKIDGSGFPKHLMGREINPKAAIIAVVDVYHNLFYKRRRDKINSANNTIQYSNAAAFLESTQNRFSSAMNYLHSKAGQLFDRKVVEVFSEIIENERKLMGHKSVFRIPINKLETGMIFAEDYFTTFGLLIAARGESITEDMKKALMRFAEADEIPLKLLVMK